MYYELLIQKKHLYSRLLHATDILDITKIDVDQYDRINHLKIYDNQ